MSGQEEGRDAGDTRADRNAGPVLAAFVLLRRVGGASGGSGPDAEPCVPPLVDLLADPLDETLGYRAVIVAAKFVVRCRCGCDVLAGTLIHGEKIHLDYRIRPCPDGAQITRVKYRVVTYPVLLTGALSCAATGCQARGGRLVRLAGTVAQAGAAARTAGRRAGMPCRQRARRMKASVLVIVLKRDLKLSAVSDRPASSTWMSCSTTSATRRSRIVCPAVLTASAPASSHQGLL